MLGLTSVFYCSSPVRAEFAVITGEQFAREHEIYKQQALEYETFKLQREAEIQAIIDHHINQQLPLADAIYHYTDPCCDETSEYPLIFEVVMFGTLEQLDLLIEAGADVNALYPGHGRQTPIYFANSAIRSPNIWFECRPEQVKRLLSENAVINPHAPLNLLSEFVSPSNIPGCTETLSLLIEKGADVNAKSIIGETALSTALLYGGVETVEILLAAGADPTIENKLGISVYEEALSIALQYLPSGGQPNEHQLLNRKIEEQLNTLRRFIELTVGEKYAMTSESTRETD